MNRLFQDRARIVAVVVAALSLVATGSFAAEDFDVDKAIATAKTPADHEAIAAYYDKEAAEAQAKADSHSKMGEDYKKLGGAATEKVHLELHCDRLAKSYARAAKEAKALAAAHRAMAKQAEQQPK
jgi:hypothetical protein